MYACSVMGCAVIVLEGGVIVRPCAGCDAIVNANLEVTLTGEAQVNDDQQYQKPSAE